MKTEEILKAIKESADVDFIGEVIQTSLDRRAFMELGEEILIGIRADVESGNELVKSAERHFKKWDYVPKEVYSLYPLKDKPKDEILAAINGVLKNSFGYHEE